MAASGYSITAVEDVPAGGVVDNLIKDRPGVKLRETSKVDIYLTREGVDVLITVVVGGSQVFPQGPSNISTVIGSIPSTQDDKLITVFGQAGDEMLISATNANAAAQEARVLVKVMPIDDVMLQSAIKIRRGAT